MVPLVCWIVVCGAFICSVTERIRVSSAAFCDKEIHQRSGVFSKAASHLMSLSSKEEYERECGREGVDCGGKKQ